MGKENPEKYTFHSLRRSSATAAADNGASVAQLMDFYGWKNTNMPQEYVSSSKASVKSMAVRLQGPGSDSPEGSSSIINDNSNKVDLTSKKVIYFQGPGSDFSEGSSSINNDKKVIYIQHMSGNINL